jgi:hypothetical protein
MRILAWVGISLLAVAAVLLVINVMSDEGPHVIRLGVQSVRDMAFPSEKTPEPPKPPAADTTSAVVVSRPSSVPASPSRATEAPRPAVRPAPGVLVSGLPRPPLPPAPRVARTDHYLMGNTARWTTYDISVDAPMRLRAGGLISTAEDRSGPEGLQGSNYERSLVQRRVPAGRDDRVMASAPYLALIGRICSGDVCAEPFVVGSTKLLCPSATDVNSRLQLWTNNYIQIDGVRTLTRFSGAAGGYAIYAEPVPMSACDPRAPATAAVPDAVALAAGQVLRKPEFTISSSQTSWRPFFLPLDAPIRIRAWGEMVPRGGARSTGPGGIVVPPGERWLFPDTFDVVVDADNRLYYEEFPYQALIGRVCSSSSCDRPFLVGNGVTVCPAPPYTHQLELWINHIIRPQGLLSAATTLSLETFDLQGRRGEYRFEVSQAASSACGR